MVKLDFYDPSGGIEVTQPHAPRLASPIRRRVRPEKAMAVVRA